MHNDNKNIKKKQQKSNTTKKYMKKINDKNPEMIITNNCSIRL